MNREKVKLDRYGRRELIGHIAGPAFIAAIFFLAAGRLDICRAWIWILLMAAYYLAGMLVILKVNPHLLNERGGWNRKKDAKTWDKIILVVYGGIGLYGHTVLMALDVGRFEWSGLGPWFILPGILLYTGSFNLVYWSMAMNKYFETGVRVQYDRDHKVVRGGPYKIVRHPGYLGLAMANFGSAMIVGSLFGILTSIATLMILILRTYLEDRTLMDELEDYRDYAKITTYRLIPLIW
jgi:protein-S-isoprenylcysteine O-methyltransferase Ste14